MVIFAQCARNDQVIPTLINLGLVPIFIVIFVLIPLLMLLYLFCFSITVADGIMPPLNGMY